MIGIHADQPRARGGRWEELHELHVDELGAGAQGERVAVAAHVDRRAVARIQARQSAGRDHRRLRRDRHRSPGRHVHCMRADAGAIAHGELGDDEVADAMYLRYALHPRAQCLGDRGTGIEEIDVHAALAVVAGCVHLREVAVPARPADAPFVHLADARRPLLAQELRELLVAQAAAGLERVGEVVLPVVGSSSPTATATVICAITVAPPRPIRLRSTSSTFAPARAAAMAAYIPAAPEPMTSTSACSIKSL
jgi:hypothetical protein